MHFLIVLTLFISSCSFVSNKPESTSVDASRSISSISTSSILKLENSEILPAFREFLDEYGSKMDDPKFMRDFDASLEAFLRRSSELDKMDKLIEALDRKFGDYYSKVKRSPIFTEVIYKFLQENSSDISLKGKRKLLLFVIKNPKETDFYQRISLNEFFDFLKEVNFYKGMRSPGEPAKIWSIFWILVDRAEEDNIPELRALINENDLMLKADITREFIDNSSREIPDWLEEKYRDEKVFTKRFKERMAIPDNVEILDSGKSEHAGKVFYTLRDDEYKKLPNGSVFYTLDYEKRVKGNDKFNLDSRYGWSNIRIRADQIPEYRVPDIKGNFGPAKGCSSIMVDIIDGAR